MKMNLLITLCIIHTFITVHSQDNVLNSTKLKEFVFANAPKEWFKYITKYLEIDTKQETSKSQGNIYFSEN